MFCLLRTKKVVREGKRRREREREREMRRTYFILATVRSEPVTAGKHRIGTMSAVKQDATMPVGIDRRPRFQGPGRNLLRVKATRMKVGVVKATKAAMAPMEKRAPAARVPPKIRRSIMQPRVVFSQTALTAVGEKREG